MGPTARQNHPDAQKSTQISKLALGECFCMLGPFLAGFSWPKYIFEKLLFLVHGEPKNLKSENRLFQEKKPKKPNPPVRIVPNRIQIIYIDV